MSKVRAPTPGLTSVFHGWRWSVRIAVAALVLAAVALLGSRVAYHEWPWSTYPSQLELCGRDFQSGGPPETRAQAAREESSPLVRVGDVPGWLNSGELWAYREDEPFSGPCRVVMFVRGGADRFKPYELLGGP